MKKLHHPEFDQEELIKAAGRVVTLIENNSHIKEASSSAITKELIENNQPDDDHFMVHLIAMGDGESYGPNRNGDWWPKKANQTYHDTFVSNGHFFREHNNRDPKKAIGIVKASAYNEDMGRIELVIHGDKEKAAEEYELAKEGKALSFSMSARVPNDRCNVCDNVATKSADYCKHLKKGMNQYVPEFQKYAYAINDKPTFFDISRVKNPADRIAHYLDYAFSGDLQKAASVHEHIFSDELAKAEGVEIPDLSSITPNNLKLLGKLASAENYLNDFIRGEDMPRDEKYEYVKHALTSLASEDDINQEELAVMRSLQPGTLFHKLASKGAVLPFGAFMAYVRDESVATIKESNFYKVACGCGESGNSMLGDMFNKMLSMGGSCGGMTMDNTSKMFSPSAKHEVMADAGDNDDVQKIMDSVSARHDHLQKPNLTRIVKITVRSKPQIMKMASDQAQKIDIDEAEKSVMLYGFYKVAAVKAYLDLHKNAAIDEPTALRIAYQSIS